MAASEIHVRLTPRSGRNEIIRFDGNTVHVRVTAPPIDGAANAALVVLLAETLSVPKSQISIGSGASGRYKKLIIEGKSKLEVDMSLAKWRVGTAE